MGDRWERDKRKGEREGKVSGRVRTTALAFGTADCDFGRARSIEVDMNVDVGVRGQGSTDLHPPRVVSAEAARTLCSPRQARKGGLCDAETG